MGMGLELRNGIGNNDMGQALGIEYENWRNERQEGGLGWCKGS